MAYARVVNVEYKSPKDMKNDNWLESSWHKDMGIPDALSTTVIRTGPNSTMLTAFCKTEELAEKARVLTNQFYGGTKHFHEIMDLNFEVNHL